MFRLNMVYPITSYCIDIYTEIGLKDTLYVNGPLCQTGKFATQDNWAAVNYIIKNYSPTNNTKPLQYNVLFGTLHRHNMEYILEITVLTLDVISS